MILSRATHDGFTTHALALAGVFQRVVDGIDRKTQAGKLGDDDNVLLKSAIGPALAFMYQHPELWCGLEHEQHGPDCTKGIDLQSLALGASLIFSPLLSGLVALGREGGGSQPPQRPTPRILPGRPRPPRPRR